MTDQHTALALATGDVRVLATPQLIVWCEATTLDALDGELPDEQTTVGMRVRIDHIGPSSVGATIVTTAELTKVDGRRLTFTIAAHEDETEVASGQMVRVIVDRERFLTRAGA